MAPFSGAILRRYPPVLMASETATIRVSRETRDVLAAQARERGQSLAAMLSEIARSGVREEVFRAERDAVRRDAERTTVEAEEREWETAAGDGVD